MTTKEEFLKTKKKKRIHYIFCEHLVKDEMQNASLNLYIGRRARVVLCPICEKIAFQTYLERVMMQVDYFRVLSLHDIHIPYNNNDIFYDALALGRRLERAERPQKKWWEFWKR